MEEVLRTIWYSTDTAAGFGSIDKLFRAARKKLSGLKRADVARWLEAQDTYTLFQGRNQPIRRRRYFSPASFVMLEADLLFLPGATSNYGTVGALTIIDVFSRFAFVLPIKNKSALTIATKLQQVLDDPRVKGKVQSFRTDRGKEFDNGLVGKVCQQRGILQYFANPNNKTKCAIVERFNRTFVLPAFELFFLILIANFRFKELLAKARHAANKEQKGRVRKRWVDLAEPVLNLYNHSPHSSLNNHSPYFASKPGNWKEIFDLQLASPVKKLNKGYFRRGTAVRIRLVGGSFGVRASEMKNSEEVFHIRQVHPS